MLLTSPLSSPLKNPVRDVFSPAGGKPSLTAQVQALFAGGKVGGMWDMGDTATLFQDAAGATPVTAVTQPIGMVLDKSQGLVIGSEMVTNGDFSNGTTGWTALSSTLSVDTGRLKILAASTYGWAYQAFTTVVGRTYRLTYSLTNGDASACYLYIDTGTGLSSANYDSGVKADGTYTAVFVATATTTFVKPLISGTGKFAFYDNISIKELPGNHATQPTAKCPLYEEDGSYGCARFDATDDALLFPAITFGGAFNTFVAGKVTSGTSGIHLWRTADVNGTWAKYKSGDATTPTGTGSGSPTYAVNGTALSPSQQGQLYTQINGVDCVVESIGVVLTAETALQLSGFVGSQFTGYAHRVLMISGTLTAGEKLLCRQWCAEGNGVTVV